VPGTFPARSPHLEMRKNGRPGTTEGKVFFNISARTTGCAPKLPSPKELGHDRRGHGERKYLRNPIEVDRLCGGTMFSMPRSLSRNCCRGRPRPGHAGVHGMCHRLQGARRPDRRLEGTAARKVYRFVSCFADQSPFFRDGLVEIPGLVKQGGHDRRPGVYSAKERLGCLRPNPM
jgi:hypothetical protein